MAFLYDLHGLVRITSNVPVPQLAYFDQPRSDTAQDTISVYVEDKLGTSGRIKRIGQNFWYDVETEELTYAPPRLLRSFRVSMRLGRDSVIRLSHSYYNATLSFQTRFDVYNLLMAVLSTRLLLRGCRLQYGACVSFEGRGVLLPAFSDVGKTTTVLSLVRKGAAQYVSDDATIITPAGEALCLPTAVLPRGSQSDGAGLRAKTARSAVAKLSRGFREIYPFSGILPSAPKDPSAYSLCIDRASVLRRVQVSSIYFLEWGVSGSREIDSWTTLNKLWALDLYEPTWSSNIFVAAYGYARPDLDFRELFAREAEVTRKFVESIGRLRVISQQGKDFSEPILLQFRQAAP